MWQYDPEEITRTHECTPAYQLRQLATETILSRLTERTTQEQYRLALDSLAALRDERLGFLDAFHRSVLYGRHRCIEEAYLSLRLQLQNAMLLRPVPQEAPPEPAAPPEPLMTPTQVIEALRDRLQPMPDATPLGIDDDLPDVERTG
jgi:hypothetical protein